MSDCVVSVHPLTEHTTQAWEELEKTQNFKVHKIKTPSKKVDSNAVRIVCISDTHSEISNMKFSVPDGDILIHAGDFTRVGDPVEVVEFNTWINSLPHKHKIVIAGNHEETFDENCERLSRFCTVDISTEKIKSLLTDCIYLQDSSVELFGIKFYGAPWTPLYWHARGFGIPRGEKILEKWNLIPSDTDVLITHGPPLGYGDLLSVNKRCGCLELLTMVQKRVKPAYHIFGHVHEAYGSYTDGQTIYINAAMCTQYYLPKNPPIVFDYKISLAENKNNCDLI